MWGVWRLHGVQAVPTPCVNQRPPRPVQTEGRRSATPLFHSALSLGQLPRQVSARATLRWPPARCAACLVSLWAQNLRKTASTRVGTRGQDPAGAVENMRRLGLIRPQDLVPSPSLGGPPAAGRQRVFVGASGSVIACSLDCGWSLAIAWVPRTGAVCPASVLLSGSSRGRTCRNTCRTPPRACSVSNAALPSAKCQAGTYAAYPVQQSRYMRCWLFSHIGGRRAVTTRE